MSDHDEKGRNEASGPQGSTTPSIIDLDTRQAIYDVDRKVEVLINEVKHVDEHRRDDRAATDKGFEKIETAVEKLGEKLRGEFKEFRKDEFKPIADAVTDFKIRWAYATGIIVVLTTILYFGLDVLKKKMGG